SRADLLPLDQPQSIEAAPEDLCGIGAKPTVEHRRIDGAEIDEVLEVAIHEVGETGLHAIQSALQGLAKDEHWRCRAVVGAAAAVLRAAAAELGDRQDIHSISIPLRAQIFVEGSDALGKLRQKVLMCAELRGLRVESGHMSIVQL